MADSFIRSLGLPLNPTCLFNCLWNSLPLLMCSDLLLLVKDVLELQYQRFFQMTIVLGLGGSLLVGFQFAVITYPSQNIKEFINATWLERYGTPLHLEMLTLLWSSIVSAYCVGGLLGSLWSGPLAVRYGKKKGLMLNDVVIIVAALLIATSKMAKSFEMILIGRFLYGISAGVTLNIHGPYMAEVSPKKLRGFANTSVVIFFSLGKALGQIMGLRDLLGAESLWPLLLAVCGFAALAQLLLLPFFPESPPYLLIQKEDKAACLKAMKDLWGGGCHQAELEDMMKEKEATKSSKNLSVLDVIKEPSLRMPLFITILLIMSLQLSGLSAIYFYTFEVFRTAKLEEALIPYVALGVGTCEFASVILCSSIIDRFGRRILLWGGYGLMALVMASLMVTLSYQDWFPWMSYCNIIFIFLFVVFYGLGPSGAIFSVMVEIFNQSARASAFVIVGVISWTGLFVIGMGFPFVVDSLGHFCFLVFLAVLIGMGIFIYLFLPETKGRSIIEITEEFNRLQLRTRPVLATREKDSPLYNSFCTKL